MRCFSGYGSEYLYKITDIMESALFSNLIDMSIGVFKKSGGLLKSPGRLTRYSFEHPDSRFDKKSNTFGVRADTKKYT